MSHSPARYHALDSLRAAMMSLGLVLHAACNYMVSPSEGSWPYRDRHGSFLFDLLVLVIHQFRMPTFFVMAGFFGALLYQRRGPARMAANRARRVLLPLALFWPPLFLLVSFAFAFALTGGGRQGLALAWQYLTTGAFLQRLSLIHLWFLYDLLLLYAAALALAALARRLPAAWRQAFLGDFARAAFSGWGLLLVALLTALPLSRMPLGMLESNGTLLPPPRILTAYGLFFAFGWFTYFRPGLVDRFARRPWLCLLLVLPFFLAYLVLLAARQPGAILPRAVLSSLASWLFVFGLTGLFVRHARRPSPLGRYLADASYWIYLVHLPITIAMAGVLAPLDWPATLKFLVNLAVTAALTVASYHLLVRPTPIGTLLNGRRHTRTPREEIPVLQEA